MSQPVLQVEGHKHSAAGDKLTRFASMEKLERRARRKKRRGASDSHRLFRICLIIVVVVYTLCCMCIFAQSTAESHTRRHPTRREPNSTKKYHHPNRVVQRDAVNLKKIIDPLLSISERSTNYDSLLYSPNNRGPLALLPRPPQRFSVSQLEHRAFAFGQRRRSSSLTGEPTLAAAATKLAANIQAPIGKLILKPSGSRNNNKKFLEEQPMKSASSPSWSQPDPRRAYSLPVSLIRLPSRSISSRRDRDNSEQASNATSGITATTTSTASSIEFTPNSASNSIDEFAQAAPYGDHASESSADVERLGSKVSTISKSGGTQMVAIIRYVPVIMNVPADHLTAMAAAAATAPARLKASSTKGELLAAGDTAEAQQQQRQATLIDLYKQQQQPRYQLSSADQKIIEQQHQQQGLSVSGDTSGDFSQIYPTSGLFAGESLLPYSGGGLPGVPASQAARLAYLQPIGQPAQYAPSTYAASKAISAYASKLISMLRPSVLLSSIGGVYSQAAQQQQQNLLSGQQAAGKMAPQIYLLAAADSIQAAPLLASQKATSAASSLSLASKPEDLLINQASRVHSTKFQQQQQQASSRWPQQQQGQQAQGGNQPFGQPVQPMSGLICIQGMIGKPSMLQQQQQSQAQPQQQFQQQQDDSFDYEKPVSDNSGQTSYQQALDKTIGGTKSAAKGQRGQQQRETTKESPMKQMQKMANRAQRQQQQRQQQQQDQQSTEEQADSQQELTHPMQQQQKLMGLSSESRSAVAFDRQLQAANAIDSQSVVVENKVIEKNGRPIIPFTIRDKIDRFSGPANVRESLRQHQQPEVGASSGSSRIATSGGNFPVQYDEPPDVDAHWPQLSSVASDDARRAKTTFVSSSAQLKKQQATATTTFERPAKQAPSIDYRKEVMNSPSGGSLPVFMASSSSQRTPAAAELRAPQFGGRTSYSDVEDMHTVSADLAPHPPAFSRPSVNFKSDHNNLHSSGHTFGNAAASSELVGSNSPVSTTNNGGNLGRLISSIELRDDNEMASTISQPTTTIASSTVELLVNSSPFVGGNISSPTITASPLNVRLASTTPAPSTRADQPPPPPLSGTRTDASRSSGSVQFDEITTTTTVPTVDASEKSQTTTTAPAASFHSHDRSLSNDGAVFGKISESLQTNPIDLIDLQNSRSSFELPSQLESLAMLFPHSVQSRTSASEEDAPESLVVTQQQDRHSKENSNHLSRRTSLLQRSQRFSANGSHVVPVSNGK